MHGLEYSLSRSEYLDNPTGQQNATDDVPLAVNQDAIKVLNNVCKVLYFQLVNACKNPLRF